MTTNQTLRPQLCVAMDTIPRRQRSAGLQNFGPWSDSHFADKDYNELKKLDGPPAKNKEALKRINSSVPQKADTTSLRRLPQRNYREMVPDNRSGEPVEVLKGEKGDSLRRAGVRRHSNAPTCQSTRSSPIVASKKQHMLVNGSTHSKVSLEPHIRQLPATPADCGIRYDAIHTESREKMSQRIHQISSHPISQVYSRSNYKATDEPERRQQQRRSATGTSGPLANSAIVNKNVSRVAHHTASHLTSEIASATKLSLWSSNYDCKGGRTHKDAKGVLNSSIPNCNVRAGASDVSSDIMSPLCRVTGPTKIEVVRAAVNKSVHGQKFPAKRRSLSHPQQTCNSTSSPVLLSQPKIRHSPSCVSLPTSKSPDIKNCNSSTSSSKHCSRNSRDPTSRDPTSRTTSETSKINAEDQPTATTSGGGVVVRRPPKPPPSLPPSTSKTLLSNSTSNNRHGSGMIGTAVTANASQKAPANIPASPNLNNSESEQSAENMRLKATVNQLRKQIKDLLDANQSLQQDKCILAQEVARMKMVEETNRGILSAVGCSSCWKAVNRIFDTNLNSSSDRTALVQASKRGGSDNSRRSLSLSTPPNAFEPSKSNSRKGAVEAQNCRFASVTTDSRSRLKKTQTRASQQSESPATRPREAFPGITMTSNTSRNSLQDKSLSHGKPVVGSKPIYYVRNARPIHNGCEDGLLQNYSTTNRSSFSNTIQHGVEAAGSIQSEDELHLNEECYFVNSNASTDVEIITSTPFDSNFSNTKSKFQFSFTRTPPKQQKYNESEREFEEWLNTPSSYLGSSATSSIPTARDALCSSNGHEIIIKAFP